MERPEIGRGGVDRPHRDDVGGAGVQRRQRDSRGYDYSLQHRLPHNGASQSVIWVTPGKTSFVDVERAGQIAEALHRPGERAEFCSRNLAGRLEEMPVVEELVGLVDVVFVQARGGFQDAQRARRDFAHRRTRRCSCFYPQQFLQRRLVGVGPRHIDRGSGERQVLHIIHRQAEAVESLRLRLKVERRQENRGIDRAGEQRRSARRRGAGEHHVEVARDRRRSAPACARHRCG